MSAPMTAREKRDARTRSGSSVDLNLVSLIDVFTILIFFLLAQVGPIETLPSPKAVQLPMSSADKDPKPAVVLVVSGTEILVEGRKVADTAAIVAQKGDLIATLKTELDQQAQRVAVRAENKPGIYVYSPDGKELEYIKTEMPTNVGFGRGKENNVLYITAGKSLYRIRMKKEGYQLPAK